MRFLLATLLIVLSILGETSAQGQNPAQWRYTLPTGQISLAYYPGNVQIDGNIITGTGAPGTGGIISAGTPPFTNTAYYSQIQTLLNGANPGQIFSTAFPGAGFSNYSTEGLTSAIIVPSTATNYATNGVASYVISNRAQVSNGGDVAGFFYALSGHSNSAVFPINPVGTDTAGMTSQILTNEFDMNVNAPDTTVNGLNLVIVGNTTLTGFRNAIIVQGVFHPTSQWSNGFVTADGAITGYAAQIGSQTSTPGTNRGSQAIAFVSYDSSNTRYLSTILTDFQGDMIFRPGRSGGLVTIQDYAGASNIAYASSTTFTSLVPVVLPSYTVATLPACNGPYKGGMAYVTDATAPTYNGILTGGGAVIIPVFCNGVAWSAH